MTRLPGVAMESALIDDNTSKQALFDLGRMLRRLHSVPQQALLDARLIPGDHTPTDVHMRFGNLFNDAVTALGDIDPSEAVQKDLHSLARLALRALPNDFECVALHSNPGLEHVFVDSDSGQLTGIIDFGDAYFSHPVFDLRRMRSAADRSSIYRGYTADQAVSEDFQTAWRVSCALTEMQKLVRDSKSVAGLQEAWSALSGDAFATF
jgi:hygromycin-B 7''-O-kinase